MRQELRAGEDGLQSRQHHYERHLRPGRRQARPQVEEEDGEEEQVSAAEEEADAGLGVRPESGQGKARND